MKRIVVLAMSGALGFREILGGLPKVERDLLKYFKEAGFTVTDTKQGFSIELNLPHLPIYAARGSCLGLRGSMIPANMNQAREWLQSFLETDNNDTYYLLVGRSTGACNIVEIINSDNIRLGLLGKMRVKIVLLDPNHGPRVQNRNDETLIIQGYNTPVNFYQTGKLGGYLINPGKNIPVQSTHFTIGENPTVVAALRGAVDNIKRWCIE